MSVLECDADHTGLFRNVNIYIYIYWKTQSSAEVKERVELDLYFPYGLS